MQLSFVLTQQFIPVPSNLPVALHGDSVIEFYSTTMPPPQLVTFPPSLMKLHSMLTIRWGYHHGNPSQLHAVMLHSLPIVLRECPNLSRFLNPTPNVASQVTAYKMIASILAPVSEAHRYETMKHVDQKLLLHLNIAAQADSMSPPATAEARAFLLQTVVDNERSAVLAAPSVDMAGPKGVASGPATQRAVKALMELRAEPFIQELEARLLAAWSPTEHRPIEVFRMVLESRSHTCIAILFENLTGVRDAGPIFDILEQAAAERLQYFSYRLATPPHCVDRPDTTLWFTYSAAADASVRSADFAGFAKLNLFELGAQIRLLREDVEIRPEDSPAPGHEFAAGLAAYHLSLLGQLPVWLEALAIPLAGKAGFEEAFIKFSSFCQRGVLYSGTRLDGHVAGMRRLYHSFLLDMHQSFRCFWNKRPQQYNVLADMDSMFPESGRFYGTLRQVTADITRVNELSRLGILFDRPSEPEPMAKRLKPGEGSSSHGGTSAQGGSRPAHPSKGLGAFAWAVKEEGDTLVGGWPHSIL